MGNKVNPFSLFLTIIARKGAERRTVYDNE